ncbi:hypothetical protein N836_16785 [Leptolyngbya sp. Heron Island J]|uniref:hypothetical protein n=1 Tax=Leptolyngbya sp. Heron Island J TaxID=1385935 RepID=UPI0003B992AE|nr:hypothetical protein [Leptolyngbya sp. Heron Island J]ESA34550.1 hypothetical protein N836_16785 [Leptolyngbya sp. Heron Island J]
MTTYKKSSILSEQRFSALLVSNDFVQSGRVYARSDEMDLLGAKKSWALLILELAVDVSSR